MYRVAVYRTNGRFVKYVGRPYYSRYSAKKAAERAEDKYDEKTYYVEVESE